MARKIIVLDDDPTGIQCVHSVPVYTSYNDEVFDQIFKDTQNKMAFVLTNSRAFTAAQTAAVHEQIAKSLVKAAQKAGGDYLLISRSDSTLRGHYPLETDVLRKTIEENSSVRFDGEILCPFFLEGGRITKNNIHYVLIDGKPVPAHETEFAKDKTFAFHHSDLTQYIEEKTNGAVKAEDVKCISLQMLRSADTTPVYDLLMACKGDKVVVNAENYADLEAFVAQLERALDAGRHFMMRTAASITRVLSHMPPKPLLTKKDLNLDNSENGGLIIVGSHVKRSSEQLQMLKTFERARFYEFDVERVLNASTREDEILKAAAFASQTMQQGLTAVVYTKRTLISAPDPEASLKISVSISDALVSLIDHLTATPRYVLAKGGITSSDVGVKGLKVQKAMVLGQIKPGIPVWLTGKESRFPNKGYIIFPGNVGQKETLLEIARELDA